jgi:hypothetical protein
MSLSVMSVVMLFVLLLSQISEGKAGYVMARKVDRPIT